MDELNRVSETLRQVEDPRRLLEQLFAFSPVAYQVFDRSGRSILVNKAFVDLFVVPTPPDYILFEDTIIAETGVLDVIRRAFDGETVHIPTMWYDPGELKNVKVVGARRVAFTSVFFPLFNAQGDVTHVVLAARDETEQMLAHERVSLARDKFQALFDSALDGIMILSEDRRFVDLNPAACEIFGRTAQEMIGHPSLEFSATPGVSADRWQALESRGSLLGLGQIRRRDGTLRHIEYQSTANFMPGLHLSIIRDVTERLELEEQLRISEQSYRELFEKAGDAIYVVDPETRRVIDMNAHALLASGYSLEEISAMDMAELVANIPEFTADRMAEKFQKAMDQGPQIFEWFGRNKHGLEHWSEISLQQLMISGKNRLVAIVRDITDRKLLSEQLQQSQKMEAIGRLAGGVAHDFNNLLTVINASSALLLEMKEYDPEFMKEMLEEISAAGERAAALTGQLLAFSRKSMISPRSVNLNNIVHSLEGMLRRLMGEDVTLHTLLAPDLHAVQADVSQMEQILINLAANARDAMPRGGQLLVETMNVALDEPYAETHADIAPGHYVRLTISDNGKGMSKETQAHIFEPFYTTKEVGKGTGLGLATLYGIIKQSNGHIMVYSEVDSGTTFKIYLPALLTSTPEASHSPNISPPPRGSETVLVVEDEEGVLKLTRRVLQASGYTVYEAENGPAALELLPTIGHFDLLLTDVVMPGMSGQELAKTLSEYNPALKVIFMSGYTDDAVIRYGVLEEKMEFLQKPFTPKVLANIVREVLDA